MCGPHTHIIRDYKIFNPRVNTGLALLLYVCVAHTHEPNPGARWRREGMRCVRGSQDGNILRQHCLFHLSLRIYSTLFLKVSLFCGNGCFGEVMGDFSWWFKGFGFYLGRKQKREKILILEVSES